MKIYSVKEVLNELDDSIKNNYPFSLIRFGDGGIKLLYSYLNNEEQNLREICKKEGIPRDKLSYVIDKWRKYANSANFIDTMDVYFSRNFWRKYRKYMQPPPQETINKIKMWRQLYQRVGINNARYCNPELNYLSCLRIDRNKNLLDIMKNRSICIISSYNNNILARSFPFCNSVGSIKIVKQYGNHYIRCFRDTCSEIKKNANKYDLFLIAGGELGRIYSGLVKLHGGRSFDIGFMIDYWVGRMQIHKRLISFIQPNPDNSYELVLTERGNKYKDVI